MFATFRCPTHHSYCRPCPAVAKQQRRDAARRAAGAAGQGSAEEEGGQASAWQQILRLDPIAQKLRRSKLARLAFRRYAWAEAGLVFVAGSLGSSSAALSGTGAAPSCLGAPGLPPTAPCPICGCPARSIMRDKLSRSDVEHSQALAAANAAILRHAARALIRNCDTLALLGGGEEAGASGHEGGAHGHGSHSSHSHGGHQRISALLCFDEMQVGSGRVLSQRLPGPKVLPVLRCWGCAWSAALRVANARLCPALPPWRQVSDPFSAVALKALFEALMAEG